MNPQTDGRHIEFHAYTGRGYSFKHGSTNLPFCLKVDNARTDLQGRLELWDVDYALAQLDSACLSLHRELLPVAR